MCRPWHLQCAGPLPRSGGGRSCTASIAAALHALCTHRTARLRQRGGVSALGGGSGRVGCPQLRGDLRHPGRLPPTLPAPAPPQRARSVLRLRLRLRLRLGALEAGQREAESGGELGALSSSTRERGGPRGRAERCHGMAGGPWALPTPAPRVRGRAPPAGAPPRPPPPPRSAPPPPPPPPAPPPPRRRAPPPAHHGMGRARGIGYQRHRGVAGWWPASA
jgi:hypothetical protein